MFKMFVQKHTAKTESALKDQKEYHTQSEFLNKQIVMFLREYK